MTLDRITFDEKIMGGRACIRGMRIPVSVVLRMLAGGMTQQQILADYPDLEPEDIEQCMQYAAALADEREVLDRMRPMLAAEFGGRLKGVVLFGSSARGNAGPDSDIDILVLLQGPVETGRDIDSAVKATYSLQLEIPDRPIHLAVADVEDYEAGEFAIYRHAKAEGVLL
jgi:uncharacterized protein (DUF433 family)